MKAHSLLRTTAILAAIAAIPAAPALGYSSYGKVLGPVAGPDQGEAQRGQGGGSSSSSGGSSSSGSSSSGSGGSGPSANVQRNTWSFAQKLIHVPEVSVFPGAPPAPLKIDVPNLSDPGAITRGQLLYRQMNCVGCHAPYGAGGMGPSLSNATWIYGNDPADIFLTIMHGRPGGMPAWGFALPQSAIWDLVAYVRAISGGPNQHGGSAWGKTTSIKDFTLEEVPAEYQSSTNPWQHTEPFSFGQPPMKKLATKPPLANQPVPAEPPTVSPGGAGGTAGQQGQE